MAIALLSDLIQKVTESQYWQRLSAAYDADDPPVPWRAWDLRNPFLALSRFCTLALSELRDVVAYDAGGMFLDFAEGIALKLFAKSQYQVNPTEAVFAVGRMLLTSASGAPSHTFAPGDITVGTPGPFVEGSQLYVNIEGGTLEPGSALLLSFQALEAGDGANLPVLAPLALKTSFAGVISVHNPPSGPPVKIGSGNSGLYFYAHASGVTISIVNLGASQSLTVTPNFISKVVTIGLATDGAGVATSTAEQVRAAVKASIVAAVLLPLVIEVKNVGTGLGLMAVTASPVALSYAGTWLQTAGAPPQPDKSIVEVCRTRWDTLGGGAGDGAPVSDAATADALTYWGLQPPAGYAASPVAKIKIWSNLDPDTGLASGGVIAIMLAGVAGALSADDVAAVEANYYNPRKFAWAAELKVRSASNLTISLVGTVNVKLSSGRSLAQVQTEVEAAMTAYQESFDIGETVYPQTLFARISAADPVGIRDVVPTSPASPVAATYAQIPVLDLSGLTYVLV